MVLTDFFDRTYCINLNRRQDKWRVCQNEFNKHSLNVERYEAIDGHIAKYSSVVSKGVLGCALSHLGIVEIAKRDGLNTVLILEDDVEFEEGLNEKFVERYKEVPKDWDMLYLGGNHNAREITNRFSPHLLKIHNTNATHAYALKSTVFDAIIERMEYINLPVDIIYKEIQRKVNSYCFSPRLAWQRPGLSDVLDVMVDYSFIKDNDGLFR